MASGIGAGTSLGSFGVYLFADSSALTRTLRQSERDMVAFQKRAATLQKAQDRAAAASTASASAQQASTRANDPTFVRQQNALVNTMRTTNAAIVQAYADRTRAQQQAARASAAVAKLEEAQSARIVAAKLKEANAAAQVATRTNTLNTGGRGGRPLSGAARNSVQAALIRDQAALAAATAAVTRAEQTLAQVRARGAQIAAGASAKIQQANASQIRAAADLQKSVESLALRYRSLANQAGMGNLAKPFEDAARAATASMTRLAAAQENLKRKQAALSASPTNAGRISAVENAIKAEQAALNTHRNNINKVIAAEKQFTDRFTKETEKRIAAAKKETDNLNRELAEQARADRARKIQDIAGVAQSAQTGFTALAAGIGAATVQFASFEEGMINVASISDEVAANLPKFTAQVQDLAVELGKAPTELAEGLYEVAQAGFEGAQAFEILELGAKAAVAGQTSVEAAVRPVIGVINAYGITVEEAADALDVMFTAVTEGIFTFEELSQQIGDNLSLAASLDVSLEELAASYVVLTKRSNNLAESTTQVNAIMNSFLKPSEALNAAIQEYTGQTAQAYFRTAELGDVLALVDKMFQDNADSAGKLFPNIRAIRGVFGLTTNEAEDFNKEMVKMEAAGDGAGATAKVLGIQMTSTAFQFKQAREQFREVAVILGALFAPAVLQIAEHLAGLAKSFAALDPGIQGLVAQIILFTAVGLGSVAMVGKMLPLILSLGRAIGLLYVALGPVGIALAAIGVAFALYKKNQADLEAFNDRITESYQRLGKAIGEVANEQTKLTALDLQLDVSNEESVFRGERTATEFLDAYNKKMAEFEATPGGIGGSNIDPQEVAFLNEWVFTLEQAVEANEAFAEGLEQAGPDVDAYVDAIKRLRAIYESGLIDDAGEYLSVQYSINDVLETNPDGSQREAAMLKILDIFKQYEQLSMKNPVAAADFLVNAFERLNTAAGQSEITTLAANIDASARAANEGEEAVERFTSAVKLNSKASQEALDGLYEQALTAAGALYDLSDPLAFLKQQFDNADLTLPQAILDMQDLGLVDIQLGQSDGLPRGMAQEALEVAAAMDTWASKVAGVVTEIRENTDAMSDWESIAGTVSDTIGTQEDGYAALARMLVTGRISYEEYNDVIAAGQYLTDASIVGKEEERKANALALIDLAAYVSQHEKSKDAYDALSPAQKGRVEALKDEGTATTLLVLLMGKLLSHLGAIDKVDFENFAKGISDAGGAAGALVDDLGIIPKERITKISVVPDSENASRLNEVNQQIEDNLKRQTEIIERSGMTRDQAEAILTPLEEELARLTEERRVLEIEVRAEGDDLEDIAAEADNITAAEEAQIKAAEAREKAAEDALQAAEDAIAEQERAAQEAADAALAVKQAWDQAFASIEPSRATLEQMANDIIPGLISGLAASPSDPFGWLTQSLAPAARDIEGILLRARQLSGLDINLDDAERQAIRASIAFDRTAEALQGITDQIGEANTAISEYEGYISLVEEALGSSTSTLDNWTRKLATGQATQKEYNEALKSGDAHAAYQNLDKLVQRGLLTQEEANRVREAGNRLVGYSKRAILEEQAAIALSIPALETYVKQHGAAGDEYKNLTDDQRGFIEALKDEAVQTALTTTLMIAQFEAMGLVPAGATEKAAKAMSKLNPLVGALFEDIGLLNSEGIAPKIDVDILKPGLVVEAIEADTPEGGVEVPIVPVVAKPASVPAVVKQAAPKGTPVKTSAAGAQAPAVDMGRLTADLATAQQAILTVFTEMQADGRAQGGLVALAFVNALRSQLAVGAESVTTELQSGILTSLADADAGITGSGNRGKEAGMAFLSGMVIGLRDAAKRAAIVAAVLSLGPELSQPAFAETIGAEVSGAFATGVTGGLGTDTTTVSTAVKTGAVAAMDAPEVLTAAATAGSNVGIDFLVGLGEAIELGKQPIIDIASGVATRFDDSTLYGDAGAIVANAFLRSISSTLIGGYAKVKTSIDLGPRSAFVDPILQAKIKSGGERVALAFINGIINTVSGEANINRIKVAGAAAGGALETGANEELEIESPSKKGEDIGRYFVQGIEDGVEAERPGVVETGRDLGAELSEVAGSIPGSAPLWLQDIGNQIEAMGKSAESLDPGTLAAWGKELQAFRSTDPNMGAAGDSLVQMSEQVQASLDTVSSSGSEFGSNLEYAADQIAAFGGDKTPKNLVDISLDLRELAESSDQLDADKLRSYADQLRATGDAGLSKTADYLDVVASNVDERARRMVVQAEAEGEASAQAYTDAFNEAIAQARSELPDALRAFNRLDDATRNEAQPYLAAALNKDVDGMIAEYERLSTFLDGRTLDQIAAAGKEIRNGVPRDFQLIGDDTSFGLSQEAVDRAAAAARESSGVTEGAIGSNTGLSESYDAVGASASSAAGSVEGLGDAISTSNADLPEQIRAWMRLPDATRAAARAFMEAAISGDKDALAAEYARLAEVFDGKTLDVIAAAGQQFQKAKPVPVGFEVLPNFDVVSAIDTIAPTEEMYAAIRDTFSGIEAVASQEQQRVMATFIAAFVSGNRAAALQAWTSIEQFMTEDGRRVLYNLAASMRASGTQAGAGVGQGLTQGVRSQESGVAAAGQSLAQRIISSVFSSLGMSSPSRVMAEGGRNAASSFVNAFVSTGESGIARVRSVARGQADAFREEFRILAEDGSLVPASFYGGKPANAAGAQRGLSARRNELLAGSTGKNVNITAQVGGGQITVQGYNKDPKALANEIKTEVFDDLQGSFARLWAMVEV